VLRVERQSARKSTTKNGRLASMALNPLVTVPILKLYSLAVLIWTFSLYQPLFPSFAVVHLAILSTISIERSTFTVKSLLTLATFKSYLKTHLFTQSYIWVSFAVLTNACTSDSSLCSTNMRVINVLLIDLSIDWLIDRLIDWLTMLAMMMKRWR